MTDRELAKKNIRHYRFGYGFIAAVTALMTIAVYYSVCSTLSMRDGIRNSRNRLGSDIVVCGSGETDMEDILFNGSPSTLYMDKAAADELKEVPHVTDFAERLYLATLEGQSCCDGKIQLIAVSDGDYLLDALSETENLGDNEIILGSTFIADKGDTVRYFGREFTVAEILEKTGTGYDGSGFITLGAAKDIMSDGTYSSEFGGVSPDTVTSMVFISSDNPQAVKNIIRTNYPELSVYLVDRKISEYTGSVSAVADITVTEDILLTVMGTLGMMALSAVMMENRKNEMGALVVIGWQKRRIHRLLFREQMTVAVRTWLVSSAFMTLVFIFFRDAFEESFGIPFRTSPQTVAVTCLILLAIDVASGFISSVFARRYVFKDSVAELIKTGC